MKMMNAKMEYAFFQAFEHACLTKDNAKPPYVLRRLIQIFNYEYEKSKAEQSKQSETAQPQQPKTETEG